MTVWKCLSLIQEKQSKCCQTRRHWIDRGIDMSVSEDVQKYLEAGGEIQKIPRGVSQLTGQTAIYGDRLVAQNKKMERQNEAKKKT